MRRLAVTFAGLAVTLLLAGCSGGGVVTMPDVVGKNLDVALSDVERAGINDEVEVLGGGMFGVVDESNWTVCSQEPENGTDVSSAPRLTVDRTCDIDGATEPTQEPEPEITGVPTSAPAPVPVPVPVPQELATSTGLTASFAQSACEQYGEYQFPYGFKGHWILGRLAEEIQNDQWFLKVEATVTNEYDADRRLNVECFVIGTNDAPTVASFNAY